ncbi:Bgt-20886 [Blumeria graminis f. sp. tritici]|uniref:Bgt-20886 n=1 Tax=Blumeria graminis f. sp. tritici TaxID=62690 RepID=A0A9X9MFU9_BLUGR|nr:Bgt-60042 [Blumeria graminis f. sp. tritici]VDB84382.1 Bgt-20886 [Blumeria graminis f. sp. tritici]
MTYFLRVPDSDCYQGLGFSLFCHSFFIRVPWLIFIPACFGAYSISVARVVAPATQLVFETVCSLSTFFCFSPRDAVGGGVDSGPSGFWDGCS